MFATVIRDVLVFLIFIIIIFLSIRMIIRVIRDDIRKTHTIVIKLPKNMYKIFSPHKYNQAIKSFQKGRYKEAIGLCEQLIHEIKGKKVTSYKKNILYSCFFMISSCYLTIGDVSNALKILKEDVVDFIDEADTSHQMFLNYHFALTYAKAGCKEAFLTHHEIFNRYYQEYANENPNRIAEWTPLQKRLDEIHIK